MWKCPNGHVNNEVMAFTSEEEIGIMLDAQTGEVTNHYADGTRGVPEEIGQLARDSGNPYCPICVEECDWVEN